jgi:hypothetical protein
MLRPCTAVPASPLDYMLKILFGLGKAALAEKLSNPESYLKNEYLAPFAPINAQTYPQFLCKKAYPRCR